MKFNTTKTPNEILDNVRTFIDENENSFSAFPDLGSEGDQLVYEILSDNKFYIYLIKGRASSMFAMTNFKASCNIHGAGNETLLSIHFKPRFLIILISVLVFLTLSFNIIYRNLSPFALVFFLILIPLLIYEYFRFREYITHLVDTVILK